MAHGFWPALPLKEIADQVRNDTLGRSGPSAIGYPAIDRMRVQW